MSKMYMKTLKIFLLLIFVCCNSMAASVLGRKNLLSDLRSVRADKWTWNANNVILEGNVVIPSSNFHIVADKVILNTESRDVECIGNIRLLARKTEKTSKQIYQSQVSILGPVGYGPTTLPLRHSDICVW